MNDQLTAYKVALMVLIEEYCKVIAVGSQSSSVPPVQRDVYSEKEDREMMMTLLTLIQVIGFCFVQCSHDPNDK